MEEGYRSYGSGETPGYGYAQTGYTVPDYAGYHQVPPPYPPYPAPPQRPRPRRGWWTVLAMVLAALLGVAVGHFLWQPTGGLSTVPHIVGSAPAELPSSGTSANLDAGVVDITTKLGNQGGGAAGTGMVLTPTGEVLTNNHVIQGATAITVTDVSDQRSYPATVVGYDRTDDVAVLQLQGASNLRTVSLGDSGAVGVGDSVVAVGNVGGVGGAPSHTSGQVTALDQSITASDDSGGNTQQLDGLIEVNANLQPGDSGGPLLNSSGKVIGMDTAGSQSRRARSTAGFAIPVDKAVSISKQIEAGRASSTVHVGATAFLGVQVASAQQGASSGAQVVGVQSGSPAAQAGLQAGDVIVSVDQRPVDSSTALENALSAHHPGDRVALQWVDQAGQQHSGTAQLASGPPA